MAANGQKNARLNLELAGHGKKLCLLRSPTMKGVDRSRTSRLDAALPDSIPSLGNPAIVLGVGGTSIGRPSCCKINRAVSAVLRREERRDLTALASSWCRQSGPLSKFRARIWLSRPSVNEVRWRAPAKMGSATREWPLPRLRSKTEGRTSRPLSDSSARCPPAYRARDAALRLRRAWPGRGRSPFRQSPA